MNVQRRRGPLCRSELLGAAHHGQTERFGRRSQSAQLKLGHESIERGEIVPIPDMRGAHGNGDVHGERDQVVRTASHVQPIEDVLRHGRGAEPKSCDDAGQCRRVDKEPLGHGHAFRAEREPVEPDES
ncbi:MAG: hypothetical protein D6695_12600, partial [Planctomycetota bacterium]